MDPNEYQAGIAAIPRDHPLRRLFMSLCRRCLLDVVGLRDPRVADYLGALLARFTHVSQLYRIRDAAGYPLEDVGEMLLESDPLSRAASLDREREVRRHIGDFTLFFLGLFPEYLARHATTRIPDLLVDWAAAGRQSYRVVAAFNVDPWTEEAPLFGRLAEQYDYCVVALNFVKQELARMSDPRVRSLRAAFGENGDLRDE